MRKFRFIDHTGDAGVIVQGRSLTELFQHAAESFFHILVKPENIQEVDSRNVSLQAAELEELLVDWLNEFLYLFDTQGYYSGVLKSTDSMAVSLRLLCGEKNMRKEDTIYKP